MSEITLRWQEADETRTQTINFSQKVSDQADAICLGRDPALCDVVFSDPRISRLHAEIRWNRHENSFSLQNLRESNPIFVEQQQLEGSVYLDNDTIVVMGTTHIQVSVTATVSADSDIPVNFTQFSAQSFTKSGESSFAEYSYFIPLSFLDKADERSTYLMPGILTVVLVISLFATIGNPVLFNLLLASYLGSCGFYIIYRLCNRSKPWWVAGMPIVVTPLLLHTPIWTVITFVFRYILPGRIPAESNIISSFFAFLFGAGLAEELLKALPIFALAWCGQSLETPQREKVGVTEPLDGIVLGAASGLGFTLIETLGQYVPAVVMGVSTQLGDGAGELVGLQLLIPRVVSSVFGHMAYSACFGYYIGLSYLKPGKRWQFLATGYLLAAIVHALWNVGSSLGWIAQVLVGILAYCLLTGSILKARQISQKYVNR